MQHRTFKTLGVLVTSYLLVACPPPRPPENNRSGSSSGAVRVAEHTTVATPTPTPTPTAPRTGAPSGTITAPEGVTASTVQCNAGSAETCNGLDDNCDGVIDNNCGYQGGGIQITVAWRGAPDIDLRVTDPTGEEVYFGHRTSASGATMDIDANGECAATRPTAENVRWATPTPPVGRYEIKVSALDLCGATDGSATMSVSVGGRVVGAWTVNFTYPRQEFVFPLTVQ
jgi:hypothetical protein